MDTTENRDLYSWFLGPKGENADLFEKLILDVVRDSVYWRRNFHPEDHVVITERIKQDDAFRNSVDRLQQLLLEMLAGLKRDIPFYSPRYIGHMSGDQVIPAMIGYFAGMLHNPNNVSREGSPVTTRYELAVGEDLARLVGYQTRGEQKELLTWGHITSGGSIANFEALWVARNLKYFAFAAQKAAREMDVALEPDIRIMRPADILKLSPDEALKLRYDLYEKCGGDKMKVDNVLRKYEISERGEYEMLSELGEMRIKSGKVIIPHTAHYSWAKVVEALGLGRNSIVYIPVDRHFRMNMDVLWNTLKNWDETIPIIAIVSVAGTTEEGAIDQIHEIVELQGRFKGKLNFFHHCDAAWGGYMRTLFFNEHDQPISNPGRIIPLAIWPHDEVFESFEAMKRTDSVTIDPHKMGYIPYPCGAIVFRNQRVRDLISSRAPYIFRQEEQTKDPFIGQYILEGSKPGASAAACWLAHRVTPLNEGGYGKIIGASLQSAFELYWEIVKDLTMKLNRVGIILHVLTDPPDTNLICFLINARGNTDHKKMNQYNRTVYDELKFDPDKIVQAHDFIVSSTTLGSDHYAASMVEHFAALGIEAPAEFGVEIIRCTVMSPWLSLARRAENGTDYAKMFADLLEQVAISTIYESTVSLVEEKTGKNWLLEWQKLYERVWGLHSIGVISDKIIEEVEKTFELTLSHDHLDELFRKK